MNLSSTTIRLHPRLSQCKECSQFKCSVTPHPYFDPIKIVECTICFAQWYVCPYHKKRFNKYNLHQIRRHVIEEHQPLHKFSNNTDNDNHDDYDNTLITTNSDDCDIDSIVVKSNEHTAITVNNNTSNENVIIQPQSSHKTSNELHPHTSSSFIYSTATLNKVIGTAFSSNPWSTINVTKPEIDFHINMTDFCCTLPETKQHQFSIILNQLLSLNFETTRPPNSFQDLRKFYLSGKYSIYQNMPVPIVKSFENHAYVSVMDIISFALGAIDSLLLVECSKYVTQKTDCISMIFCEKARQVVNMLQDKYKTSNIDPLVLFVTLWSDDFEVNHTRKNRNSTWMKTISFAATNNMSTSKYHSHIISLGKKGDDHTPVNNHINQELLQLRNVHYFYVHKYNKKLPVIIYPIAILADRPERCSLNSTLSYTGSSTRRWLYASLIDPRKLASCASCFSLRLKQYFNKTNIQQQRKSQCNRCCDFDFHSKSSINMYKPPSNYPKTKHPQSPVFPHTRNIPLTQSIQQLYPAKMSYEYLVTGVKAACYNFYKQHWKTIETRTYLKHLGVSNSIINSIIDYTKNLAEKNLSADNVCNNLQLPCLWTDGLFEIDQFLETPMHHLFEGIIKSMIELTMEYLKWHKQWSQYCEMIHPLLDDIDSLNCNFCRVESFWELNKSDYKPTGWIAENYLGYSRIISLLLCCIDTIVDHNSNGYQEFKCMIQASFVLISHLMSHSIIDVDHIDCLIKVFLGTCHMFDTTFGMSDELNPFWYRKSNFVSLLNLPSQINKYGPVYLYWEGVKERYIQHIKPFLKNKRRSVSFLKTRLQQLLQQNALELTKEQLHIYNVTQYSRYDDISVFVSSVSLQESIQQNEPINVVILNNEEKSIVAVIQKDDMFELQCLMFDDNTGFHKNNLWFAPVKIDKLLSTKYKSLQNIQLECVDVALIIPYEKTSNIKGDDDWSGYSLFTKNWFIRTQDGSVCLPRLSQDLFQKLY